LGGVVRASGADRVGGTAVQIVHKRGRTVLGIEHVGSAHEEGQLAMLLATARARLSAGQQMLPIGDGVAGGRPVGEPVVEGTASLIVWKSMEAIYASLGFDQIGQVTVGLLTTGSGFPLEVHPFEGNKAETKTLIPVLTGFADRLQVADVVVVADAGMLTLAEPEDREVWEKTVASNSIALRFFGSVSVLDSLDRCTMISA